jgi:hypothetical protein
MLKSRRARESEPWLIIASPELDHLNARQAVGICGRRMQIDLSNVGG